MSQADQAPPNDRSQMRKRASRHIRIAIALGALLFVLLVLLLTSRQA